MNRVARVRIMFVCVFLLSTACLYLLRQWEDGEKDTTRLPSKKNVLESGVYFRDNLGYIYHKEYFQQQPQHNSNLFYNASLEGRHSDALLTACDIPYGNQPTNIKQEYRMTGQFDYLEKYKNPCWYSGGWLTNNKNKSTVQCIPYYYIIGTPKAGTSDLFWRIRMHPDVAPFSSKETRWFDSKRFLSKEKQEINYYKHEYRRAARNIQRDAPDSEFHKKIFGDGSPSYLFNNINWPLLPGNEWCLEPRMTTLSYIHNLFPNAKLILIVRNPVDRLYSGYLFSSKRTGARNTPEEFHSWAKETIRVYRECFKELPFRYCLYNRKLKFKSMLHSFTSSIYSRLILDALRVFPRIQLLVLQMEDYSTNMAQRLVDVFDFLGLDHLPPCKMDKITRVKPYNKGRHYEKAGKMLPETRKMIYDFYRPFNEELAQIMDDEKFLWKEKEDN